MKRGDGNRFIACRCGGAVCLLLFGGGAAAADEDLNMLRTAHRSARESIRTFSAKVTNEDVVPKDRSPLESTYWRSLDTVRIQTRTSGGSSHILVKVLRPGKF